MLGDLFYEAKGRITSKRVLDLEGPKTESSYFLEGKMRGKIEVVEIITHRKKLEINKWMDMYYIILMSSETTTKANKCEECGTSFDSENELHQHMNQEHVGNA